MQKHKAGFVNIIGNPNVGKSTLMNALVGEKLSIITSKVQTTRHRIMGIINSDDFQIVYSDTPGIVEPKYELHKAMMRHVRMSLEDADLVLFVTDIFESFDPTGVLKKLEKLSIPVILVINKTDLAKEDQLSEKLAYWEEIFQAQNIIPVSALKKSNLDQLITAIVSSLPLHPPYFPKEQLTDKPARFFAAEIVREKIFLHYKEEIPYSCTVLVTEFKEEKDIIRIRVEIYVERKTQKGIIIGHKGAALKKVGTEARIDMEHFFDKRVFLETYVKVVPDWRKKQKRLSEFGYE